MFSDPARFAPERLSDLRGRRVAIGAEGSGTLGVAQASMSSSGLRRLERELEAITPLTIHAVEHLIAHDTLRPLKEATQPQVLPPPLSEPRLTVAVADDHMLRGHHAG